MQHQQAAVAIILRTAHVLSLWCVVYFTALTLVLGCGVRSTSLSFNSRQLFELPVLVEVELTAITFLHCITFSLIA